MLCFFALDHLDLSTMLLLLHSFPVIYAEDNKTVSRPTLLHSSHESLALNPSQPLPPHRQAACMLPSVPVPTAVPFILHVSFSFILLTFDYTRETEPLTGAMTSVSNVGEAYSPT